MATATPPRTLTQHEQWMTLAGIPESDWEWAEMLVQRESSWRPTAVNSTSGACGLAQAYPCSKIKGDWQDPVVSLQWQANYVKERYGGYEQAWRFWQINKWY